MNDKIHWMLLFSMGALPHRYACPAEVKPCALHAHRTKARRFPFACAGPHERMIPYAASSKARPPTHAPHAMRAALPRKERARTHTATSRERALLARVQARAHARNSARAQLARRRPEGWQAIEVRGMNHRTRCWAQPPHRRKPSATRR